MSLEKLSELLKKHFNLPENKTDFLSFEAENQIDILIKCNKQKYLSIKEIKEILPLLSKEAKSLALRVDLKNEGCRTLSEMKENLKTSISRENDIVSYLNSFCKDVNFLLEGVEQNSTELVCKKNINFSKEDAKIFDVNTGKEKLCGIDYAPCSFKSTYKTSKIRGLIKNSSIDITVQPLTGSEFKPENILDQFVNFPKKWNLIVLDTSDLNTVLEKGEIFYSPTFGNKEVVVINKIYGSCFRIDKIDEINNKLVEILNK